MAVVYKGNVEIGQLKNQSMSSHTPTLQVIWTLENLVQVTYEWRSCHLVQPVTK